MHPSQIAAMAEHESKAKEMKPITSVHAPRPPRRPHPRLPASTRCLRTRPRTRPRTRAASAQVLWNDPMEEEGTKPNDVRSIGLFFGPGVARRFLRKSELGLIVRSHEQARCAPRSPPPPPPPPPLPHLHGWQ